jgi:addiction module HigA family antidote
MMHDPSHPGELLREDVLAPLGLAVTEAAEWLGVSRVALSRVLHGHAGISPDLAIRLEQAGVSPAAFWLGMQTQYDLAQPRKRGLPAVRALIAQAEAVSASA